MRPEHRTASRVELNTSPFSSRGATATRKEVLRDGTSTSPSRMRYRSTRRSLTRAMWSMDRGSAGEESHRTVTIGMGSPESPGTGREIENTPGITLATSRRGTKLGMPGLDGGTLMTLEEYTARWQCQCLRLSITTFCSDRIHAEGTWS